MEGYIKLHRSVLDWEWFDDGNTFRLFMYLLLKANHKERNYRGTTIKAGETVTGLSVLSKETGLSIQQIRTSIKRLKSTNEITSVSTSQGTKIQVVNYAKYQQPTSELTNSQQTTNKQLTTNKNEKNEKNDKNKKKNIKKIEIPVLSDSHKNELFKEWLEYKKDLGKPIKTSQGMKQLAKQFEDNNSLLIRKNMDKSIANGWQGLFYDNNKSTGGNLAKDIVTSKLKELLPEPPKPENYDTPEGQEYIRVFQHNLEVRRWNTKHVYKG
jgi:hypothetical protein